LTSADFGDSLGVVVRNIDDTGLDQIQPQFVVAPNPANAVLHVSWFSAKNMIVQVIDIYGKLLLQEQKEAMGIELNIETLSSGTYIVQLIDENGIASQKKFIKQ